MTTYHETRSYKHFNDLKSEINAASPKGSKLDPVDSLRKFGLTKFAEILDTSGMARELAEMPALTLFVPTNQAIENLSPDDSKRLLQDASSCRELVQIHAAPGFFTIHAGLENLDYFDLEMVSLLPMAKITWRARPEPTVITSAKQENACAIQLFNCKTRNGGLTIIDAVLASSEDRRNEVLPWPAPGTITPGDPRPFPEHDQVPADFRLYGAAKKLVIREAT